jgi:hypothetical protein
LNGHRQHAFASVDLSGSVMTYHTMRTLQFLTLGTMAALFVISGAWGFVWFSGVPISQTATLQRFNFKPLIEVPESSNITVTPQNDIPQEPRNRIQLPGKNDNDRKVQNLERGLDKKINSICRGC